MNSIIICGDSFSIGIGCRNLTTEPYGVLLGNYLNKPVINLAKGSSTNLSIFLQAKYAVEKLKDQTDLVIVSNTSYDRVEWMPLDYECYGYFDNTNINYHQYPPYHESSYVVTLPHPLVHDVNYTGRIFTENYRGVIDYWENFGSKNIKSRYYVRFENEPKERMKALYDYAKLIHEDSIDKIKSIGVLALAHQLLIRAGINHLILADDINEYKKYIDERNLCYVSWGRLSVEYPDDLPSLHTSPEGHRIAFETVLAKLKENNWVE